MTTSHRHHSKANRRQASENRPDLAALKQQCPLPSLMEQLGLGAHAKPSCKSPFRHESNASWGIFETDTGWRFKDHGTDESGDEITLLAHHLKLDQREHFRLLLDVYQATARKVALAGPVKDADSNSLTVETVARNELPDRSGLGAGSDEQHQQLATLRGFNLEAVQWAIQRGVLVFGAWQDFECYGVADQSGLLVELRRLDGLNFPAAGELSERKSHALKHSRKSWPVGLMEAGSAAHILLVEGVPDFLSAHELILLDQLQHLWSPVAMLSANAKISVDALTHFSGKRVLIWFHVDTQQQGLKAALKWHAQLRRHSNTTVSFFDTGKLAALADAPIKDLNDYLRAAKSNQHADLPQPATLLTNLQPQSL